MFLKQRNETGRRAFPDDCSSSFVVPTKSIKVNGLCANRRCALPINKSRRIEGLHPGDNPLFPDLIPVILAWIRKDHGFLVDIIVRFSWAFAREKRKTGLIHA